MRIRQIKHPKGTRSLRLSVCYFKWDSQEAFSSQGTFGQRPRLSEGMDHAHMSGVRVFWVREQQMQRTVSKITF